MFIYTFVDTKIILKIKRPRKPYDESIRFSNLIQINKNKFLYKPHNKGRSKM